MALPEGWSGNDKVHHRTVGPFRITVRHGTAGMSGSSYGYRIESHGRNSEHLQHWIFEPRANIHYDAAAAQGAAMLYLQELAREIMLVLPTF